MLICFDYGVLLPRRMVLVMTPVCILGVILSVQPPFLFGGEQHLNTLGVGVAVVQVPPLLRCPAPFPSPTAPAIQGPCTLLATNSALPCTYVSTTCSSLGWGRPAVLPAHAM